MDGTENAFIESVFIGIEDHGIPAIAIRCGGQFSQSYGAYGLEGLNFPKFLEQLLKIGDCYAVEHLKKKPIRIERKDGLIRRLGHFHKDYWVDIKDFYAK